MKLNSKTIVIIALVVVAALVLWFVPKNNVVGGGDMNGIELVNDSINFDYEKNDTIQVDVTVLDTAE